MKNLSSSFTIKTTHEKAELPKTRDTKIYSSSSVLKTEFECNFQNVFQENIHVPKYYK